MASSLRRQGWHARVSHTLQQRGPRACATICSLSSPEGFRCDKGFLREDFVASRMPLESSALCRTTHSMPRLPAAKFHVFDYSGIYAMAPGAIYLPEPRHLTGAATRS